MVATGAERGGGGRPFYACSATPERRARAGAARCGRPRAGSAQPRLPERPWAARGLARAGGHGGPSGDGPFRAVPRRLSLPPRAATNSGAFWRPPALRVACPARGGSLEDRLEVGADVVVRSLVHLHPRAPSTRGPEECVQSWSVAPHWQPDERRFAWWNPAIFELSAEPTQRRSPVADNARQHGSWSRGHGMTTPLSPQGRCPQRRR